MCDICIKIWVGEVLFAEMLLFQRSVVFGQFKKTNNLKTILRAPFAISEYSGMNYIESCVLLGQTLYSFIQMKVKTMRQQKSANVSSSTSRQFYNFLSRLRVNGRILGELRVLIELQFWKVLQSAGWSHSCEGVLGLNECLSSFCPVAQGAKHDRENVNPAIKKHCLLFQANNFCCAAARVAVPRKIPASIFRKDQPVARSCEMWWKNLHLSHRKLRGWFRNQEVLKGHRSNIGDEDGHLAQWRFKTKIPRQQKQHPQKT